MAENSNCRYLDDNGDLDIVVCPTSGDQIIEDEMIEYLPQHPLHIRIKGADHPVLQSCLVEGTEYVAASALKNYNPAIFGNFESLLMNCLVQIISEKIVPFRLGPRVSANMRNKENSPALTYSMNVRNDNIFQGLEKLEDSLCLKSAEREIESRPQSESKSRKDTFTGEATLNNSENTYGTPKNHREDTQTSCSISMDGPSITQRNDDEGPWFSATLRQPSTTASFERFSRIRESTLFSEATKSKNEEVGCEENKISQNTLTSIDFVPALKARGWPKVAQEWINRERKWPSPDLVDRVTQEGFHFVVKPPKNGGNTDCYFRLSFAHAEYLLSQEMNDIQRECYRCVKTYYRAYLCTETKSLLTYHLKNILLQTIEETGSEMWTESNRAECMMKLFGNLLDALKRGHLRHFFVKAYNLFCDDYIQNPTVLSSLAKKVEQIMKEPMPFAKKLIENQLNNHASDDTEGREKECFSTGGLSARPVMGQGREEGDGRKEIVFSSEEQALLTYPLLTSQQGSTGHQSYHKIKEIYLAISKDLTDKAFNDPACSLEDLVPLERAVVEDLREIQKSVKVDVEDFRDIFQTGFNAAYSAIIFSFEPNIKLRILKAIQSFLEITMLLSKEENSVEPGNELTLVEKLLDLDNEESVIWRFLPQDDSSKSIFRMLSKLMRSMDHDQQQKPDTDDIPLD